MQIEGKWVLDNIGIEFTKMGLGPKDGAHLHVDKHINLDKLYSTIYDITTKCYPKTGQYP